MWTELMQVPNRYVADIWKELFDAEGVATRIVVLGEWKTHGDFTPRAIWVPDSKTHVAAEILRKV